MAQQKKNSIPSAVVSNAAKKWTHIDPSKSPERKKEREKKSAATFVRRCLGDAVAKWRAQKVALKTKATKPQKRLFCESTIRNRFDPDTDEPDSLFFLVSSEKAKTATCQSTVWQHERQQREKTNLCVHGWGIGRACYTPPTCFTGL